MTVARLRNRLFEVFCHCIIFVLCVCTHVLEYVCPVHTVLKMHCYFLLNTKHWALQLTVQQVVFGGEGPTL